MLEGEEKLIRGAKQGKTECFEKLYDYYLPPIYRFIYMKVSHREETEDLAHEVFLNAWQNIHGYTSRGFPFGSWLYQIARNKVIDYYRLKKTSLPLDAVDTEVDVSKLQQTLDAELDQELNLERVRLAIQELHGDQQDVILMRFMEDLSHDEIAQVMQKSTGAVRIIQHRALNTLKKRIYGK